MGQEFETGMPSYKEGSYGNWPYNISDSRGQTYCNQAVFATIRTLDEKFVNFLNDLKHINNTTIMSSGDAPDGSNGNDPNFYTGRGRKSNYWCQILERAAARNFIVELTMEEAQRYANMGYLVIGSYENMEENGSPHFVTVRPGGVYSDVTGAEVAHVGAHGNAVKSVAVAPNALPGVYSAYGNIPFQQIKWYYNTNQKLRLDWQAHLHYFRWRAR
jgi:hypothetical protein